jgi:hypothetical protein
MVRLPFMAEDTIRLRGLNRRGEFVHLRTGNPAADKPALLAAVLADGTNLDLARMADTSRGLG